MSTPTPFRLSRIVCKSLGIRTLDFRKSRKTRLNRLKAAIAAPSLPSNKSKKEHARLKYGG